MDEFDDETDKAHDKETYPGGARYLSELFPVRLVAFLDQMVAVFREILERIEDQLLKLGHGGEWVLSTRLHRGTTKVSPILYVKLQLSCSGQGFMIMRIVTSEV